MHRGTKRVLKDSFRSFKIIIVFVAFRIFIIARCSRLIGNHVSGNLYYFTFERASQHFLLLETWNNFSKTLHPFSQKISFWLKIWRYPVKLSKNLGLKKESRHFSLQFLGLSRIWNDQEECTWRSRISSTGEYSRNIFGPNFRSSFGPVCWE